MNIVAGELFESGILTEDCDIRAHVSVCNRTVYVFPTRHGREAIERYEPQLRSACQPGVIGKTAEGWLVQLEWIEDLRKKRFESWEGWDRFKQTMTTSEKGKCAVACVIELMKRGHFPFWLDASEDDRENVQIKGTDILVFCRKRVQVKCDWRAGETGNLYLQKAERNPLRRY